MRAVYTPSQSSFGTFGRADDKDELTGRVKYNVRVVSTVLEGGAVVILSNKTNRVTDCDEYCRGQLILKEKL